MAEFAPPRDSRRPVLLPLILAGILAITVGAACWLIHLRGIPARRGAELLKEFRRAGLSAYWPKRQTRWFFLVQGNGATVGWRATVWDRAQQDTTFGNFTLERSVLGEQWEWSLLNADATKGVYRSGIFALSPSGAKVSLDTVIILADGKVRARRLDSSKSEWVEAPAPDNYLPEGMGELGALLAGRNAKETQFRMLIHRELPPRGAPDFATLVVQPGNPQRIAVPGAVLQVTRQTYGLEPYPKAVEFFDKDGRLVRVVWPSIMFVSATEEEMAGRFPDASALLKQVMQRVIQSLAPTEEPEPPGPETGEGDKTTI